MRVLLTGALGNVGSHTVSELLAAGHRVRCLDLPTPANQKRARGLSRDVEMVWGDITDPALLARAVEGVEHVLHLAAVIPPHTDVNQTLGYRVNVGGLTRLVAAIKAHA